MASRKEQKEAARQERLAKQQEAEAAERRKRMVGIGAAGVLVVAIVVVLVVVLAGGGGGSGGVSGGGDSSIEVSYPGGAELPAKGPNANDLKKAVAEAGCQLKDPPNEGSTHVEEDVTYTANPPTSGNHNPVPSEDSTEPLTSPPKTEASIHALEHGRVEIQFRPDAPEELRGQLAALLKEDPYHMFLFPNGTKMEPLVAATAWDHQLLCPRAGPKLFDAIRAFKNEYRDKGPEFVP